MQFVHDESSDDRRDRSLAQLWLVADPVPRTVIEAAKAAFSRHPPGATVLPMVFDLREPDARDFADQPTEALLFGAKESAVEIEVQAEVVDRALTLRCVVRTDGMDPSAVMAESPTAQYPLGLLSAGVYGASELPAGPLRVSVEFAGRPDRSVVTSWFTA